MNILKKIRKGIFDFYHKYYNIEIGEVIMLHRLGPWDENRLISIEELKVTLPRLQKYIDEHRSCYDFISMEELEERLSRPRNKPFICVTLDDGYTDNLIYGLPFFTQNNIPFTLFITTDFIDNPKAFNWPFIVERIIMENKELLINGNVYDCNDLDSKNKTFQMFRKMILDWEYAGLENKFNNVFKEYLKDIHYEDITMTWDEIKKLAASPLCTIGSHCVSHCRVINMNEDEIFYEFARSKQIIESHIGKEVKYISYPFGCSVDIKKEAGNIAKKAGYKLGFSVGGYIRKINRPMLIPRKMIYDFR